MSTVKWVVVVVLLAAFAAMALRIAFLQAERAELRAEIARQEELVRNREARIAGLELVVAARDRELAAVAGQVEATQRAMDQFHGRVRQMQKILSAAVAVDAKPGSVIDDQTNRDVVRHLNELVVPPVVRDQAAGGDSGPDGGEAPPVPEALRSGSGPGAVGRDPAPGQP